MILGTNRDERDDDADRCRELSGGEAEMSVDGTVDAVLGRADCVVEAADWLERYEYERVIGGILLRNDSLQGV
jgi:hypothetical protein